MEFSLVPNTVGDFPPLDVFDNNCGMSKLSDEPSDNFEPIVSPRAAMLLGEDLAFRPAPTAFAPPGTNTLYSLPAATNRASLQRPKSQEDWEAKKETIRSLYMDENMPLKDLVTTMSSKHSFSATGRMFKRQFSKWNWKKYNTKSRQKSHINGELTEIRCGKSACKRPRIRRVMGVTNQARNYYWYHGSRIEQKDHRDLGISISLLFSNQCNRWTEGLYVSLRDLVYGSARQSPAWRECSKFEWLEAAAVNELLSQFELVSKLFKQKDFQEYGTVIRRAFRTIDAVVENESCEIIQSLLLNVPQKLIRNGQNNELRLYLHYVSQLLSAKMPGDPIGAMAKMMHAILLDSPTEFSRTLAQLHGITADFFTNTRGSGDLASLCARVEATLIKNYDEVSAAETESILSTCSDLVNEAINLFGEYSKRAIGLECNRLSVMESLGLWDGFEDLCDRHIRRIRAKNEASWDSWDIWDLDAVVWALRCLSVFYKNADDTSSRIRCLKECICILDYLHKRDETIWGCGTRAAQRRMELIGVLSEGGRLQEASEVRLDLIRSGYLREVVDTDFEYDGFES